MKSEPEIKEKVSDMYYHKSLLKQLVDAKSAKVILELGVRTIEDGLGETSTHMFYEALASRDRLTVPALYSCDLEMPLIAFDLVKKLKRSPIWQFFHGDTREQFELIKEMLEERSQKVDILFIDTDKTYELTKYELSNYPKLLSDTGVILLHDVGIDWEFNNVRRPGKKYTNTEEWEGHDKAIMEFLEDTDFKMTAQLGSYNMAVLYRDDSHIDGVKLEDLPYDNNRHSMSPPLVRKRRERFNRRWKAYKLSQ